MVLDDWFMFCVAQIALLVGVRVSQIMTHRPPLADRSQTPEATECRKPYFLVDAREKVRGGRFVVKAELAQLATELTRVPRQRPAPFSRDAAGVSPLSGATSTAAGRSPGPQPRPGEHGWGTPWP
jgi:hypothetical protein